jgi:hypothetical protein
LPKDEHLRAAVLDKYNFLLPMLEEEYFCYIIVVESLFSFILPLGEFLRVRNVFSFIFV